MGHALEGQNNYGQALQYFLQATRVQPGKTRVVRRCFSATDSAVRSQKGQHLHSRRFRKSRFSSILQNQNSLTPTKEEIHDLFGMKSPRLFFGCAQVPASYWRVWDGFIILCRDTLTWIPGHFVIQLDEQMPSEQNYCA